MKKIISTLLFFSLVVFVIYACKKNNTTVNDDTETFLYKNANTAKDVDPKTFILGGNTKLISKIAFSNSLLDELKKSEVWTTINSQLKLNLNDLKRTYFYSSSISLVTIPIIGGSGEDVLNIFISENKFLITKIAISKQPNGNKLYQIKSAQDELCYQFELDTNDKIGHWNFEKKLPFKETFGKTSNQDVATFYVEQPCGSQPFNDCMNCFIVKTCGSDWMCVLACGAFIPSCIAGAAIVCAVS